MYTKFHHNRVKVKTCIMYHTDHVTQLEIVRIEPFNQLSLRAALFPGILIRGCHKFIITGPLYSVMVKTPAKEITVPRTFAIPRGFRTSTTSNLHLTQLFKDEKKKKKVK